MEVLCVIYAPVVLYLYSRNRSAYGLLSRAGRLVRTSAILVRGISLIEGLGLPGSAPPGSGSGSAARLHFRRVGVQTESAGGAMRELGGFAARQSNVHARHHPSDPGCPSRQLRDHQDPLGSRSRTSSSSRRQLLNTKRSARLQWLQTRFPAHKRNFNQATKNLKAALIQDRQDRKVEELSKLDLCGRRPNSLQENLAMFLHLTTMASGTPLPQKNPIEEEVASGLASPLQLSPFSEYFTPNEVKNAVRHSPSRKSPGEDEIVRPLVLHFPRKTIVLLTQIYNAWLRLGYFPAVWRHAIVILVRKPKKAANDPHSYRPISLLTLFSKIFERLLAPKLMQELAPLIPPAQFGFRNQHSRIHQLHRVVDNILDSFEEKETCIGLFLDTEKALDRVLHAGLLYKIKPWLPDTYFRLVESYLTDRTFAAGERCRGLVSSRLEFRKAAFLVWCSISSMQLMESASGHKLQHKCHTVLLPSPRTDERNGTGGAEGRTNQPINDGSDPHYLRRQRHDKTFDREIFAVSANDADWSRVSSDDFPGGHLEVLFIGPVMVSRSRGSLSSGQPRVINHWPWVSSGPAATIAGVLPFTFSTRALLCKVHIGQHHAHRRWPGIWDSTYNPLLPSL
ncbi:unnamed protein product [Nesidiocoris tenuis]|uniref:Reverse transcriptase domain-containing protein n=1 Tax=Nesidiocoris tenuis TaxID=355587 RepID=A0A6H5HE99_9HEMI|nr:unnamed protein product [Nesidiocoris tenuis]